MRGDLQTLKSWGLFKSHALGYRGRGILRHLNSKGLLRKLQKMLGGYFILPHPVGEDAQLVICRVLLCPLQCECHWSLLFGILVFTLLISPCMTSPVYRQQLLIKCFSIGTALDPECATFPATARSANIGPRITKLDKCNSLLAGIYCWLPAKPAAVCAERCRSTRLFARYIYTQPGPLLRDLH